MSLDLDFGDISGVEPREIPHEESDLEDEVFSRLEKEKTLTKPTRRTTMRLFLL